MPTSTFTITSATDLATDIALIDATGADAAANTAYTFNIGTDALLKLTSRLDAINLDSGSSLTINGNGATLNGGGTYNGLFVYSGTVAIDDLAIDDSVAVGGNGGSGGGAGAGLGGGLFVAGTVLNAAYNVVSTGASVTLDDVSFNGDSAKGGNGGAPTGFVDNFGGGGGLLGGNGGTSLTLVGAGGGGVGAKGSSSNAAGSAGIIPGAPGGGSGSDGESAGGGSGGGGGGGDSPGEGGGGGGVGGSADGNYAGFGGFGGFGGGGGGGGQVGGDGGFGGGGGGGLSGGSGGFGGGGGGGLSGAFGGFGGGNGGSVTATGSDGGGGLGAGGAIFVQQGGSLNYVSGSESGDSVAGGAGSTGGGNGSAFGSGLFLQGNQQVTLSATANQPLTISGVIADQTGSGGTSSNPGAGRLVIGGSGTVTLSAANTYTGGTTLTGGTFDLANAKAAGSGAITFAAGDHATLQVGAGDTPAYTVTGFVPGETIDLSGVGTETTATLSSSNLLTLSGGSSSISLQLDPTASYANEGFSLKSDGTGGTDAGVFLVTTTFNVTSASQLATDIALIDATGADAAANIAYTFNIATDALLKLTGRLDAINLDSGSSLTINGNGATLNGGGTYNGLFVYSGTVTIDDLAIDDSVAVGGNGGSGGGAGAGLGGGLFVAGTVLNAAGTVVSTGASVTLDDVSFNGDSAKGGTGGVLNADNSVAAYGGGGGLLGGNGAAVLTTYGGGGGGGVGANGSSSNVAGSAGIIPGAPGGGSDPDDGYGPGGGSGGGGGGGTNGDGGGGGGVGGGTGGDASGHGGFGGGGGGGFISGGQGGFGGGGGGGSLVTSGAAGGFGGGGAGNELHGGSGGFGAGNGGGNYGGGGGGLGAGGAIFVQQGGTLNYVGGSESGDSVAGGAGESGGGNGSAFGSGLFLQGNQQVTLSATANQPLTISDVIADQTGSGGTGSNAGAGGLIIAGPGTVTLSAANTYTGGTTVTGGTFDIAKAKAAGSGAITLSGAPILKIEAGDAPANTIDGFRPGATIDLAGVGTETTATLASGNTLTVAGTAPVTLHLDPTESFRNLVFTLAADGQGGTDVTLAPSVPPTITGTVGHQATTLEAPIDPFSSVVIADGNFGATDTLTISLTGSGALSAAGLIKVNAATYTLSGTAGAITTALQALSFTPTGGGAGTTHTTEFTLSDQSSEYTDPTVDSNTIVIDTDPAFTITGSVFLDQNADGVQGAGDTGLSGQTVTLLNASSQAIATTTTNSNGQYSFTRLAAGSDTVQFAAPAGDQLSTPADVPVTLAATTTLTVNAGVYVPAAIDVLTYFDANGNGTQDNGEAGLAGVDVALETGAGTLLQVATTTTNGAASFTGLVPGSYQVAITTPPSDTVTQQVNVDVPFTLTSGASAQVTEGLAPQAVAPSLTASQTSLTTQSEAPLAPFAGVTVTDPNAGATDTVMVGVTGQGGTLSGTGVAAAAGGYTITGSAATITALVAAASFTPAAGAPDTSGVTQFSLTDTSSRDATTTPAVPIRLTDIDPAVAISATDAANSVAITDEQAASPFTGVSITDPNANQSETARVSLSAANGTLSDSLGGIVSGGVYSVTGSASAVAADLDALVFTPTAHEAAPGTVVSTLISAAISDTAGEQTSLATTVRATAVDDTPTISGTPPASLSVTLPQTATPLAGVAISDPDNQTGVTETLTITETGAGAADALGSLSLSTTAGVSFTEGTTGTYTLAGSLAAVAAALPAVTFTPQVALGAGQTATLGFSLSVVQTSGALQSAAATAAGPTLTLIGATGTDNSTVVNLAGYYDSVVAPATAAPYTTATGPTVNGPPYGSATIDGTGKSQTINAFGYDNTIIANGGNDTINAGQGEAAVTVSDGNGAVTVSGSQGNSSVVLGNGNDLITLGGYSNTVTLGSGNDTVNAGQGNATITLGGGTDSVTVQGYDNRITISGAGADTINAGQGNAVLMLGDGNTTVTLGGYGNTVTAGNGNDSVTGPQGTTSVMLGNGADSVTLGGYGNVVTVGNGADTIVAGAGSDNVTAGAGRDTVTLAGWTNTVSLGGGSDTLNAGSGDTIAINGTTLGLKGGTMETVTVGSAGGSLTDQSSGTEVKVGTASGSLLLSDITADKSFLLDLLGGVGGYTSYAALAKAFVSDGHGGTALPLGAGMIDFVNTPQTVLTAAMFRFN